MGGVKNKIVSLFKTNITKYCSIRTRVNKVYGGGKSPRKTKYQSTKKKKSKDSITEGVKNIFRLKKKNEAIKARIFRDIKNLFE